MPQGLVLVTRPEPGASGTAERVREAGFLPVIAPLLTVEPRAADLPPPDSLRAIVIASRQALPALSVSYAGLPLFAVGDSTAEAARRQGFVDVRSAAGDAEALARLVARSLPPDGPPLLLATGLDQGIYLKNLLERAGLTVMRREVYAARPVVSLPEAARDMIRNARGGWVLLFSRETAFCFGRLVQDAGLVDGCATLSLAAISPQVAEAVGDLPWRTIRVAMDPTENAVLALLND